jgi:uncharacterized protein
VKLLRCKVEHTRLRPKTYKFSNNFLWFHFSLKEDFKSYPLLAKNRFNLYSFRELDYLPLGGKSLWENISLFLRGNKVEQNILDVEVFTNLSFLGYLFNPVCFFLIRLDNQTSCALIQIGNTFGEVKPFFIPPSEMKEDSFKVHLTKYFYISPFLKHDNSMDFSFSLTEKMIQAHIVDKNKEGEVELVASMKGESIQFSLKNLIIETVRSPFNTFKVIFFIHYHALKLFMMKIPYLKKSDHQELQQGALSWKKS